MAVHAEADEVAAADGQVAVEGLLLGHVAELGVAPARRRAVHAHGALRQAGPDPSSTLSSVVLPVPFGPSTARNSPSADVEVEAGPQRALAEAHRGVLELDRGGPGAWRDQRGSGVMGCG